MPNFNLNCEETLANARLDVDQAAEFEGREKSQIIIALEVGLSSEYRREGDGALLVPRLS